MRTKQISIESTQNFDVKAFKYNCLHAYKTGSPYTVAIDWLQYAAHFKIDRLMLGTDFTKHGYRWLFQGHGTKHYKFLYHIYKGNDQVFTVEVTPHKSKDNSIGLVRLDNWLLYRDWYSENSEFISAFIDSVVRVSRLDIAIDGMGHVRDLLHECTSGQVHNYKLLGKSKINAYDLNRITGLANGYRIGTPKGHKQISIYNKSKELAKGNKPYIKQYWERNGLKDENTIRFECRMKSGFLTRVIHAPEMHNDAGQKGQVYTPELLFAELQSPGFLLSLVELFLQGFFEFRYTDDKNVKRCTPIQIVPDAAYQMQKSKLEKRPTNYKARLTIHNLYAQVCDQKVNIDDAIAVMTEQLRLHELYDWYATKIPEYDRLYVDHSGKLKSQLHALVGTKDFAEKENLFIERHLKLDAWCKSLGFQYAKA